MSSPATPRSDLLDVHVPKSVWSRSTRPLQGRLTRGLFGSMMVLMGLSMPWPVVAYSLMAIGVLGFFLIPVVTDFILARWEPGIMAANKDDAEDRMHRLGKSVLVSAFAPDAWVTLQRGRLFLAQGDGRAAAQAFADTARVLQDPDMPAIRSAQARALLLAGDRTAAREHLDVLEKADTLAPRDRLDLGVVMLDESARADAAREHLQEAYEQLDGHPQAAAALAIALARTEDPPKVQRGLELLTEAEAATEGQVDTLAQGLVKRARKALRPAREAKKRKRKRKG